ncbi:MAG: hypothetical protein U0Q19_05255 [Kineosporiaceae bacterium]
MSGSDATLSRPVGAAVGLGAHHSSDDATRISAELREVEYWRRLVAARLDLAVAAVTSLDEPVVRELPSVPRLPCNLRRLVGLPQGDARGEVGVLEQLRGVLHDLDSYALALRSCSCTPGH